MKLLLLLRLGGGGRGRGGLGLGGEVAREEFPPEGGVDGEASKAAGSDGEAAEVAEPQRGRRGSQLQDASPQLVGKIRRRHVPLRLGQWRTARAPEHEYCDAKAAGGRERYGCPPLTCAGAGAGRRFSSRLDVGDEESGQQGMNWSRH